MARYEIDDEMNILKVIAETLNRSNDLTSMLHTVLEKLLELTRLETGWMFLVDEKPHYTFIADHQLPPALTWEGKKPMCNGSCSCLSRYWKGQLNDPINIIECKRIDEAIKYEWGDTNGITHHATVPLTAGEERFGILNVASPNKEHFTDEELTLLQSVAYQIGSAIKRTRLYHAQQKRAENYANLNEVIRLIWKASDVENLTDQVVKKSGEIFHWPTVGFFTKEGNDLYLRSCVSEGKSPQESIRIPLQEDHGITKAFNLQKVITSHSESPKNESPIPSESSVSVPLSIKNEHIGVIYIASPRYNDFSESDIEVLQALAGHVSLAFESIRLQERSRELLLYEERNRLARDLHDSVNQKLFSLSLTARGAKEVISQSDHSLSELLDEMLGLSQDSLKEMRTLIWQLRPVGVEEGLLTAMEKYGEHLGIKVVFDVARVPDWSRSIEETLWRISQEALNNINKHANTREVIIRMHEDLDSVRMEVIDHGDGFELSEGTRKRSLGLTSMKERAELMGGILTVDSTLGTGTTIHVSIPWNSQGKSDVQ